MLRTSFFAFGLGLLTCAACPAFADSIDSLRGQFTFNWHTDPDKTRCAAVNGRLLSIFKSDAFQCNLEIISNTASGEPARVCTEKGDGAEYLIFETEKACELERETQASNGP